MMFMMILFEVMVVFGITEIRTFLPSHEKEPKSFQTDLILTFSLILSNVVRTLLLFHSARILLSYLKYYG